MMIYHDVIFYLKRLVPVVLFLLFGSITVALWQNQNSHRRELVCRYTENSAQQIKIRVEELMKTRMASLRLLAERWVERKPPDFSKKRFLQFANTFYTHFHGFKEINWINPEGVVKWVFPEDKNAGSKDDVVYNNSSPGYREAFEKARRSLEYSVTPCIDIHRHGMSFETFWPLIYDNRIQGYLNGIFQITKIMENSLTQHLVEDFWIRLYEDSRLIYMNEFGRDKVNIKEKRPLAHMEINFSGKKWKLEVEPKAADYQLLSAHNSPLLIFGFIVSTALSLLLYRLLRRIELYRKTRDSAFREVSQRKAAEEELLKNEKKLKSVLDEIASKNKELETFVYMISHDLKTPIVTIEGFIGAMREDFGIDMPEGQKEYLRYMSDAALKMEALINDLLELSRIGRLPDKKSNFSFACVVEDVLKSLQSQILSRGIEVKIQKNLPDIYADKKRFMQVMENLLTNAVKYIGRENPCPRIDIGVYDRGGRHVYFVRDNGIGIDDIYFEKIFQVFQRLPAAKKSGKGTGVGLAIVKRIIENYGGSVWVKSKQGEGSAFFFTINNQET